MGKEAKNQRIKNSKQVKRLNNKPRDLEERFVDFFVRTVKLCKKCPKNPVTSRIITQLTASCGSVPANYAEASEAMSKKDFNKSLKIARKEAKESKVWLRGLKEAVDFSDIEFDRLIQEATEII